MVGKSTTPYIREMLEVKGKKGVGRGGCTKDNNHSHIDTFSNRRPNFKSQQFSSRSKN